MMYFVAVNIPMIEHLENTLHKLTKICWLAKSMEEVSNALNTNREFETRSNKFVFETLKFHQSCDLYMLRNKPRLQYMPTCCESCQLELKSRYTLGIMLLHIKRYQEGVRIAKEFRRNNSIGEGDLSLGTQMREKQLALDMFLMREELEDDLSRVEHRQIRELCQGQEAFSLAQQLDAAFHYDPL